MSARRQLDYLWQRFLLGKDTLLAEDLPLGLRLEVPTRDDVGRRLYKYGFHEPDVLDWIQALPVPEPGALALDVGANLGWYTLVLDRLTGGRLEVHAFEPDPDNRALLARNLDLNDAARVTVSALALSDQVGEARLNRYRAINRGKHSLLPLEGAVDSVPVQVGTLDDYLEAAGLGDRPLWLLKLDVEGLEPAVIRGAARTLHRIEHLVMEYSPMYHEPGAAEAMTEALWNAGLRPALHDGETWIDCSPGDLSRLEDQRDTTWRRARRR